MSNLPDIPAPFPEYAEKAGRRAPGHPPADFLPRMVGLLARRPDLEGIGITYLVEAVAG